MTPHRVVIAGGGVAGLEAMIALRELAGDLVDIMLVAPTDRYVVRALSVEQPFAQPTPAEYDLASICADHGAAFRHDAVQSVHRESHTVTTASGEELAYDSLLVAIGARPSPAFPHVTTFRGLEDGEAMHGLIQDVEGEYTTSVAFVVPRGTTWPLPIYELALMTADRADGLSLAPQLTIVTPEPAPLAVAGPDVSDRIARLLADRGVAVRTGVHVRSAEGGLVVADDLELHAGRIVALPRLNGPHVVGLPADAEGFLPVDEHGRVAGLADVYGAGDGTTNPIKQGGVAAQEAVAAAQSIAAAAGADVEPEPFSPVLHVELVTEAHAPTKVAAPHLAPYLMRAPAAAGRSPRA